MCHSLSRKAAKNDVNEAIKILLHSLRKPERAIIYKSSEP